MKKLQQLKLVAIALVAGTVADAATLTLSDGSRIEGDVLKIHEGKVYIKTVFAGDLEIPQSLVIAMTSEAPVALRTSQGNVLNGPVSAGDRGTVVVETAAGRTVAPLTGVVSAWGASERDPQIVAAEQAAAALERSWAYSLGFDLTGSDGNSDTLGVGLQFSAVLEGGHDRLNFYGSYAYQKENDIRSKDEQIGGVRYTNFFTEKMGWFVRQELERDTFEGIDFRSTTAGGLTYRFFNEERTSLEGSAGLSYRYEDYTDPLIDADGFAGLDFGLLYMLQFADWGRLNTSLKYLPSFDDFGDYLLDHESSVDMPLGNPDFWVLRIGLSNKYNSAPSGGREKLDTTYFVRLLLNWK